MYITGMLSVENIMVQDVEVNIFVESRAPAHRAYNSTTYCRFCVPIGLPSSNINIDS